MIINLRKDSFQLTNWQLPTTEEITEKNQIMKVAIVTMIQWTSVRRCRFWKRSTIPRKYWRRIRGNWKNCSLRKIYRWRRIWLRRRWRVCWRIIWWLMKPIALRKKSNIKKPLLLSSRPKPQKYSIYDLYLPNYSLTIYISSHLSNKAFLTHNPQKSIITDSVPTTS